MKNSFVIFTALLMMTFSALATKHIITASGIQFAPNSISNVFVGDTIRWVWVDGFHTTTSLTIPASATAWDSPLDNSSTSFEYTLAESGTYNYKCTPHFSLGMTGTLTASNVVLLCDTLNCDDLDACSTDDCDNQSGCINTIILCDDGDQCTADTCNAGCVYTPTLIEVNINPPQDTIFIGDSITLTAVSDPPNLTYSWSPSETVNCDTCTSTVAKPLFTTEYTIIAMDENGCANSAGALIVVKSDTLNPNSLNEFSFLTDNIMIYPNPVNDGLTVKGVNSAIQQIFITDIFGKRVYDSGKLNALQHLVNVKYFSAGVYLVQTQTNTGLGIKKLVIGE